MGVAGIGGGEPLAGRDIAAGLLVARAIGKRDRKLLELMTKRDGMALRTQRENGAVQSEQGSGQFVLGRVAQ